MDTNTQARIHEVRKLLGHGGTLNNQNPPRPTRYAIEEELADRIQDLPRFEIDDKLGLAYEEGFIDGMKRVLVLFDEHTHRRY